MAWKSFHVGTNVHPNTAAASAAPIITEQLGTCSYASEKLTYTYGGTSYSVQVKSGNSSHKATYILLVNTDTGEFFISASLTSSDSFTFYNYIASAILLVQVEADNVLVPVTSFAGNYNGLFNVSGSHASTNTTNRISLYPAVTSTEFGETNKFRPAPSLYASYMNFAITAGQTIEVDGQQFLCVACSLFAKL